MAAEVEGRHSRGLKALHWLSVLLVVPMLAAGYSWLRPMATTDPAKLDALMIHMALGVAIVALTALRLVVRLRQGKPGASGVALWGHRAIYACIFLMPVSGFAMVVSAGLNDIVFARNGAPLPADMATIPGHFWHGATALVLAGLIAAHIFGAALDEGARKRMV